MSRVSPSHRDPARIPAVLAALGEYWIQHPDLRLTQIVSNAGASAGFEDTYYLEDTTLIAHLSGPVE